MTISEWYTERKLFKDMSLLSCFRFIDEDRLNGRCEITSLATEFSSFTDWDTSVSPLFNVYIKHSYCPEARHLLQPPTTQSPTVAGRILAPAPFVSLSGSSLDFYPSGSHYLQNDIFPDSRKKLYFKQKWRGKWEFLVFSANELSLETGINLALQSLLLGLPFLWQFSIISTNLHSNVYLHIPF